MQTGGVTAGRAPFFVPVFFKRIFYLRGAWLMLCSPAKRCFGTGVQAVMAGGIRLVPWPVREHFVRASSHTGQSSSAPRPLLPGPREAGPSRGNRRLFLATH